MTKIIDKINPLNSSSLSFVNNLLSEEYITAADVVVNAQYKRLYRFCFYWTSENKILIFGFLLFLP
jgi:hypothetical protein